MLVRLTVLASAFCLLPVLSAQTAKPKAAPDKGVTVLVKSTPDLSGKAVVIEKEKRTAAITLANAKNEDFYAMYALAADWDTLGWIYFKENELPQAESYVRRAWPLLMNPEGGLHMGKMKRALTDCNHTQRRQDPGPCFPGSCGSGMGAD